MSQQTEMFRLNPIFNWFNIKKSAIHGLGLFTSKLIQADEPLGIALLKKAQSANYLEHLIEGFGYQTEDDDWLRVIGVRFINHSPVSNIRLEYYSDRVLAFAKQELAPETEIIANYAEIYREINLPIPDFCI